MNTTIQLALVFMKSETESDYIWALLALREMLGEEDLSVYPRVMVTDRERALISASQNVFPQISLILCRWHIGNNVLKACKKHFETEEAWDTFYSQWNSLINSISEPEYEEHLREFCRDQPVIPVTYCLDTWLLEWKEKLVKAWVDRLPHFGHTITSRIEGSHAKLKNYLATSTLDLKGVYDKVILYWIAQHMDYDTKLALARSRTPHQCQTAIFSALVGKIHPYTLNKIHEQLRKLSHLLSQCSGTFRSAQGLPCAHDLHSILQQQVHSPLQSIHGHWHFDRLLTAIPLLEQPDTEIILDPLLVQPRGQPQGALNRGVGPAQTSRGRSQVRAAQNRGVDQVMNRRNGRGQHRRRARARAGVRGTSRHPSAFEIAAIQLPSSSAP